MSRIRQAARRRHLQVTILPLSTLLLCAWATSFPPETHERMSTEILESVAAGKVMIDGQLYAIDEHVRQAIARHPDYFRAGTIGPDAFPDIAFGQAWIHPDSRCLDTAPPGDPCAGGPGKTYTYQWLDHVYRRGWAYYDSLGGNDRGQEALAFAYGFLTHSAGDVWGHTLVNAFARGVYPPMAEIARNPAAGLIAVRHIVVDEYVGTRTTRTDMPLRVPYDFIYQTFITDTAARRMGDGYLFAHFMKMRDHLQAERNAVPTKAPRGCISVHSPTGKCLQWVARGAITAYLDTWIWYIDRGLKEWPYMAEDVAVDLFKYKSASKAEDRVSEFATDRLAPMVAGPPGAISRVLDEIGDEAWKGMPDVKIGPIEDFKNSLFKQAFGMTARELASYMTAPESWLARPELQFAPGVRDTLDRLMSLQPDGTFSPAAFAAYRNAVVLAKLLLLPAEELNRLQGRYELGRIYDIADAAQPMNAMLGWIRSLDADHQWRARSPAVAGAEGMPLWRSCVARDRLFRRLFVDWEHTIQFPDGSDPCVPPPGPVAEMPRGGR